jgi:hypothetical protein
LLDRACSQVDNCKTSGSAELTSGLTADSAGFGRPRRGRRTIMLSPVISSGGFVLELLWPARATSRSVPAFSDVLTLSDEYRWHEINGGMKADAGESLEIRIAVTGETVAELADIRAVGLSYAGCALRRLPTGGDRRRR